MRVCIIWILSTASNMSPVEMDEGAKSEISDMDSSVCLFVHVHTKYTGMEKGIAVRVFYSRTLNFS